MIGIVGLRRKVTALEQAIEARVPDSGAAPAIHEHDSRYYTQPQVDALVAAAGGITLAQIIAALYPVGSIVFRTENPGTTWGIGTWEAFGTGRVFVGLNAADADFDTLDKTGGAKTHTLTESEMPTHTHVQNAHTHVQNAHQHTAMTASNSAGTSGANFARGSGTQATLVTTNATATNQNATATNQNTGGGQAHNNMPPYIVVQAWRRTA